MRAQINLTALILTKHTFFTERIGRFHTLIAFLTRFLLNEEANLINKVVFFEKKKLNW